MFRVLGSVFLLLALVVNGIPVRAEAQVSGNPLVSQGEALYDDLRYEEALQTLSAALIRAGNAPADLQQIYRLLALTYFALSKQEEAEGAFRSLLALDGGFEFGREVAPRFREFFAQVRARWESEGRPGRPAPASVSIAHTSPAQAMLEQQVVLEASVTDPDSRVASMVLAYRQGVQSVLHRLDMERVASGFVATLPAESVRPPLVEYYIEALDRGGLPIASRGDVLAPLRIAVPEPRSSESVFTKWWFWTGAAVLVAGAAVGTWYLVDGSNSSGGSDNRATLIVRIDGAQ